MPQPTPASPDLPHAGLLRRLAAMCYDSLLLLAVLFVASALVLPFTGGEAVAPGNPFFSTYLLFVCYFFFAWFWIHGGQTLGMRAWRLRVQRPDGGPISWAQALLRFFAAIPSLALFGLGYLWILVDRERMSWNDRFSETVVVVLPQS
ncbi:RDD family protein [Thiohalobacter sp. IOR34]|uniref:RDD family protein n=1 Tax=Thiohalobacter sp. IOR34 TaxID=3057176 RepID=UPI0025B0824A|nr:RDD family protein [Thiohalobacter sp. IOR34]WJW74905.1 RDD family protein [Thiohalobacter sp. IOR34]